MKENKIVMITGANSGLGKETARQLALEGAAEKIYLACRNQAKAEAAKKDLEAETGKNIFEIIIMDTSNPESVKKAVQELKEPVDGLIMNAGGMGGKTPEAITKDGVTQIFASNTLGHVVLVNELIAENKINNVVVFASSEAARGIKSMGMKTPEMNGHSVDDMKSVIDGSHFQPFDSLEVYGYVKYVSTLWMSSMARKHKDIKFISVSPGATKGTGAMDDLKGFRKFMFKYIAMPIMMPMMGMNHSLDKGAKRYVEALSNDKFKSGKFYASTQKKMVGPLVEQSQYMSSLGNTEYQDNAHEAIHQFLN